jgi:Tfp pilus assembly protein PilV
MVIISIAAVALMQGLGLQSQRNVDPMIQSQAQRLAIQYLQEVSSKPFFDPAADPRLNPFIAADNALVVASIADQTGNASANRLAWDNVFEYDGYNDTIKDLNGTAIAGLVGYQVNIEVSTALGLSLGNAAMANSMDASCPAKIALISVTVTDPRDQETSLSGYRTSYWNAGC